MQKVSKRNKWEQKNFLPGRVLTSQLQRHVDKVMAAAIGSRLVLTSKRDSDQLKIGTFEARCKGAIPRDGRDAPCFSPLYFFHALFPYSALISSTDGAARIFAYHLMPQRDLNPYRVAPDWDL